MSILIDQDTRIIVQGITGKEGSFHTQKCLDYGSQIVAGVTPGKGGNHHLGLPVFDTVKNAVKQSYATVTMICVPHYMVCDAIMESAEAGIKLAVVITEGIALRDLIFVKDFANRLGMSIIGPNTPGIISSGKSKVGIMPDAMFRQGNIGLISRSGTLTYEAAHQLSMAGLGVSTAVGIGGDAINGLGFIELLSEFEQDEQTQAVLLIGEIGGCLEIEAAQFIKDKISKPIFVFIAGQSAPEGKRMGHAGAIIAGHLEDAQTKMQYFKQNGAHIIANLPHIGEAIKAYLSKTNSLSK